MKLSNNEKIMYEVMNAIYESNIPINFKGSMVLKAYLSLQGYNEDVRHTGDIDANWYSEEKPSVNQICESLQKILKTVNEDYIVTIFRDYGDKCSAGFNIINKNTDMVLFSMDIDVNRARIAIQRYEIENMFSMVLQQIKC